MIPLIDLQIKQYIENGLERLRKNPEYIDTVFEYASQKTKDSIKKIVTKKEIHLLTGYPHKEAQLPCIIIQIAPEEEIPHGIGDGIDEGYPELGQGRDNYLHWTEEGDSKYVLQTLKMNAQVRVEVWSDNTIVTSFLYAVVKYCLISEREKMQREGGIELPQIMGGDLEPAPEYFNTVFIFRRAVILTFNYYIDYPVDDQIIGLEDDHFQKGTTIDDIKFDIKGVKLDTGQEDNSQGRRSEEDRNTGQDDIFI